MAIYKVILEYTTIETYVVQVEATSKDIALDNAIHGLTRELNDDNPDFTYQSVEQLPE